MKMIANKILYSIVITIVAIITIASNTHIFATQKVSDVQSQKFYVTADGGLRMRAEANTNAGLVTLIPFGAEVESSEQGNQEETIAGKTGKWHKVTYIDESKKGYTGWVFGGFLNKEKPANRLRPCESLNLPSLKIFYGLHEETINPEDGKRWPDMTQWMPRETDVFILNADGSGLRKEPGFRGGHNDFPVHWEKKEGEIIVQGEAPIRPDFSDCNYVGNACYSPPGWCKEQGFDCDDKVKCAEQAEKKCENDATHEFRKKFGNKNSVHMQWEIRLIDKGFVQIKEDHNDYPHTGKDDDSRIKQNYGKSINETTLKSFPATKSKDPLRFCGY